MFTAAISGFTIVWEPDVILKEVFADDLAAKAVFKRIGDDFTRFGNSNSKL